MEGAIKFFEKRINVKFGQQIWEICETSVL